ncbi:MAG: PspA/IM30 family protein [Candidatus Schekmanbacteria bacterium]|nr:PspA/IM30 family protein [Candidatus Schekmanbacteria bacterium]
MNINDLMDRAEDPQRLLDQVLREMEDSLREAKVQVARAIADEKKLMHQYETQAAKAEEWERKAVLAVQKGEDDLAREALRRKRSFAESAEGFSAQINSQQQLTATLRNSLRELELKVDEARRRKALLIARAKRAEAQKTIQRVMRGMSTKGTTSSFDRLEAHVGQLEAEAEATVEASGDPFERRFQALEVDDELESELTLLKAQHQPKELPSGNPPRDPEGSAGNHGD